MRGKRFPGVRSPCICLIWVCALLSPLFDWEQETAQLHSLLIPKEIHLMNSNHDMHSTDYVETKMDSVTDAFSQDTTGLAEAIVPHTIELQPDQVFELRAEQVRKSIGDTTIKMLAYNRSIPGPSLKV